MLGRVDPPPLAEVCRAVNYTEWPHSCVITCVPNKCGWVHVLMRHSHSTLTAAVPLACSWRTPPPLGTLLPGGVLGGLGGYAITPPLQLVPINGNKSGALIRSWFNTPWARNFSLGDLSWDPSLRFKPHNGCIITIGRNQIAAVWWAKLSPDYGKSPVRI